MGRRGQELLFEPLVVHGTFMRVPCTVFAAESIALDEASTEAANILASNLSSGSHS